ncbi:MAG: hypothetical protein EA351_02290 [Gemmatimonadales bacterium]|nr:MAG: hypothetical protein EA351_02290 [Gemmatimonadales bacterium]
MSTGLDAGLTFETFVVGPANRLASAAARRAAESPGEGYNPLFLYSASGLGKSHILSAIAQHTERVNPDATVRYETVEGYLDNLTRALQKGDEGIARDHYRESDVLLLDDVQFLTGQAEAQEMLLRTLDTLTSRGGQVVLASDRPPAEINDLDARLLSRFSGGLIVDIGQPDYETRVAIIRRKAEDRGAGLAPGVAEAVARYPFGNVRELQGALNRLLAVQELEERTIEEGDVPGILGALPGGGDGPTKDPARAAPTPPIAPPRPEESAAPPEPAWKSAFREVIEAVEAAGFSSQRLRRHLDGREEPEDWREVLRQLRADVDRLREMKVELERLGNPWPEAAATLLRDPERIEEAESLLASARERARSFPSVSPGPDLDALADRFPRLAVRAAEETMAGERPQYNPLYLHSTEEGRLRLFLEGVARSYGTQHPGARVAMVSVPEFAEEFIRAISDGVAGAWRERWWTVDLLLLHKVEGLAFTERAQEEFFHLFEALKRQGGRIILTGDRAPGGLEGVEERLRTRFEGGLVVDLGTDQGTPKAKATGGEERPGHPGSRRPDPSEGEDILSALRAFAGVADDEKAVSSEDVAGAGGVLESAARSADEREEWYPHRERVVWVWPHLNERIVEEDG